MQFIEPEFTFSLSRCKYAMHREYMYLTIAIVLNLKILTGVGQYKYNTKTTRCWSTSTNYSRNGVKMKREADEKWAHRLLTSLEFAPSTLDDVDISSYLLKRLH
jgi:hypothetical protein